MRDGKFLPAVAGIGPILPADSDDYFTPRLRVGSGGFGVGDSRFHTEKTVRGAGREDKLALPLQIRNPKLETNPKTQTNPNKEIKKIIRLNAFSILSVAVWSLLGFEIRYLIFLLVSDFELRISDLKL
jgi:hypothetical protein